MRFFRKNTEGKQDASETPFDQQRGKGDKGAGKESLPDKLKKLAEGLGRSPDETMKLPDLSEASSKQPEEVPEQRGTFSDMMARMAKFCNRAGKKCEEICDWLKASIEEDKNRRKAGEKTPQNGQEPEKAASELTLKQKVTAKIRRSKKAPWWQSAIALVLLLLITILSPYIPAAAYSAKTNQESSDLVTMNFVGDVMLGRYEMTLGETSGYDTLFANVADFWASADLVFANLECAVIQGDTSDYELPEKSIYLYSNYEGLEAAMEAGINVWACGNNHAFDYGEKAVLELTDYFETNNIAYSGIGASLEDAASYQIIEQNGLKVAFISIADIYPMEAVATESQGGVLTTNYGDYNLLVYQAAREADLTVVYIHWGEENETSANSTQVSLGHQLADAGADIIIGSHPHVVQEVELYEDSIIFYSLGNFVFDQGNTYARDSVMVEYSVDADGNGTFLLYTVRIEDGVPQVTTNWFYQSRINSELTQGLEEGSYTVDTDGFIVIPFNIGSTDGG